MSSRSRLSALPPFARHALAAACFGVLLSPAQAATYLVTTEAQLWAAIVAANTTSGAHFIDLGANIVLNASLPELLNTVSVRGNGYSLDGQSQYRLFTVGMRRGRDGRGRRDSGEQPQAVAVLTVSEAVAGAAPTAWCNASSSPACGRTGVLKSRPGAGCPPGPAVSRWTTRRASPRSRIGRRCRLGPPWGSKEPP